MIEKKQRCPSIQNWTCMHLYPNRLTSYISFRSITVRNQKKFFDKSETADGKSGPGGEDKTKNKKDKNEKKEKRQKAEEAEQEPAETKRRRTAKK